MFLHIKDAKYVGDYRIEVSFNDGRNGIVDLSSSLHGTVFAPLKDKSIFARLKVDKELETITWPNGADFAPEFLYFHAFKDDSELRDRFKEWGYIA